MRNRAGHVRRKSTVTARRAGRSNRGSLRIGNDTDLSHRHRIKSTTTTGLSPGRRERPSGPRAESSWRRRAVSRCARSRSGCRCGRAARRLPAAAPGLAPRSWAERPAATPAGTRARPRWTAAPLHHCPLAPPWPLRRRGLKRSEVYT